MNTRVMCLSDLGDIFWIWAPKNTSSLPPLLTTIFFFLSKLRNKEERKYEEGGPKHLALLQEVSEQSVLPKHTVCVKSM
jgi:hypothetical protein